MKLSALNRKLVRDLLRMKGQVVAIALVIGAGAAMFVMYMSNFDSLWRTREAYYDRQRFADVFASLKRAPNRLAQQIAEIPGVANIDTRVVADVVLDVPGLDEPARGRLISIPATERPHLNDVFLRSGRWIEREHSDEILASEAFAITNKLQPGDSIGAIINGRRRELRIVGIALSPEYVYSIPPGEIIPDDRRYGIFWMEREALSSAFDMKGGFNDVALKLMPGASVEEVVAQLDRLIGSYGGLGAIPRALQFSHWTLESELKQLRTFGFIIPLIFFGVAAFILNVALNRVLTLQRSQIASLRALGYSKVEVGSHYVKLGLVIAALGAALGIGAGTWLGRGMAQLYNQYFRFPVLEYRLSIGVAVGAVAFSLAMAALGAVFAVRRAVRIPPAEAMRPEAPAQFRPSFIEKTLLLGRMSNVARMILRNIERQPFRAFSSIIGIGFGTSLLVVAFFFVDSMDVLKEVQFFVVQRQDATVTFVEPVSARAFGELRSLPGVLNAEPMRAVHARLRHEQLYRTVSILGLVQAPKLNRIVNRSGEIASPPPEGLLISKKLAEILRVAPGDEVVVEVLEGWRPVRTIPVSAIVDDYLGLSVYMERSALAKLMREGESLSGAYLQVDSAMLPQLYSRPRERPLLPA